MSLWKIDGDKVVRGGQVVATVRGDKIFAWEGFGMERIGFTDKADLLRDVKYFYRYRPPKLVLTFESGRKVVVP